MKASQVVYSDRTAATLECFRQRLLDLGKPRCERFIETAELCLAILIGNDPVGSVDRPGYVSHVVQVSGEASPVIDSDRHQDRKIDRLPAGI